MGVQRRLGRGHRERGEGGNGVLGRRRKGPVRDGSREARLVGGKEEKATDPGLPGRDCGQQCPHDCQSCDVIYHSVACKFLLKVF